MRRTRILVSLVAPLIVAAAASARAQAPVSRLPLDSLNGEWSGVLALDNSAPHISLVFQVSDSSFAGKVYMDGDLLDAMSEGSLRANTVHFKVGRLDLTGTITGSRMKIDVIVYNGTTRTFTATKALPVSRPPVPSPSS